MKPELSNQQLLQFLTEKYGSEPQWAPIAEGMESRVLTFIWGDQQYILRVNPNPSGFQKDRWCFQQFHSEELPIPEILEIGSFSFHYAYCLSRRLPGITLEDSAIPTLQQLTPYVSQVWKVIHQSLLPSSEGFGPFNECGHATFSSWQSFLQSTIRGKDQQWDHLFASNLLDATALQPVMQSYLRLTGHCPEERKLVHGDFGSNNVLTDGKKITGVLDWDCALYGDPLFDVAGSFFWSPWLDCMRIQSEFFQRTLRNEANFAVRLQCYQLQCGLEEIHENALAGNQKLLNWLLNRTMQIHQATEN
ncbi:MAG: aminoglycoside phosphotransferase family protein [SAR324 cluster bacterium]|nr:aminoglycoside phosphotransferase family protein [SAR324 cluster bacterium]